MVRRRFEKLEPERREALLAAAADEFAARGYVAASMSRIAEGADVSKGTLYYYFEDKEDLFVTAVDRAVELLMEATGLGAGPEALEAWLDSLDAGEFWSALREMARRSVPLVRSDAWYVRLARSYPRIRQEPEARASVEKITEWGRGVVRSLLGRGRELGVVRTDLPLDYLVEIYLAMDSAGDRWVVDRYEGWSDEELLRFTEARIDLVRDMLEPRRSAGAAGGTGEEEAT